MVGFMHSRTNTEENPAPIPLAAAAPPVAAEQEAEAPDEMPDF